VVDATDYDLQNRLAELRDGAFEALWTAVY